MFSVKAINNMVQNTLNASVGNPVGSGTFITMNEKVVFTSYGESITVRRDNENGEVIKSIEVEAQNSSKEAHKHARSIMSEIKAIFS